MIKKQILIQIKVISLCKEIFLEFLSIMFLFKTLDIEETLLNGVPVTQVSLGSKNINSCCLNKGQIKTVNYNSSHSI